MRTRKNESRDDAIYEVSSKGSRMTLGQTALTGARSTDKTVAALIYSCYQRDGLPVSTSQETGSIDEAIRFNK